MSLNLGLHDQGDLLLKVKVIGNATFSLPPLSFPLLSLSLSPNIPKLLTQLTLNQSYFFSLSLSLSPLPLSPEGGRHPIPLIPLNACMTII
jgi:hypothetical protein